MKTPLETRGSRANDGKSARLGKKQPDGTHAHRIAHVRGRVMVPGPRAAGRELAAAGHGGHRPAPPGPGRPRVTLAAARGEEPYPFGN